MKHLRAYHDLSSAMAIVGSLVVVGKMITAHFPVFLAGALRFAIASAILLPLLYVRERRSLAANQPAPPFPPNRRIKVYQRRRFRNVLICSFLRDFRLTQKAGFGFLANTRNL